VLLLLLLCCRAAAQLKQQRRRRAAAPQWAPHMSADKLAGWRLLSRGARPSRHAARRAPQPQQTPQGLGQQKQPERSEQHEQAWSAALRRVTAVKRPGGGEPAGPPGAADSELCPELRELLGRVRAAGKAARPAGAADAPPPAKRLRAASAEPTESTEPAEPARGGAAEPTLGLLLRRAAALAALPGGDAAWQDKGARAQALDLLSRALSEAAAPADAQAVARALGPRLRTDDGLANVVVPAVLCAASRESACAALFAETVAPRLAALSPAGAAPATRTLSTALATLAASRPQAMVSGVAAPALRAALARGAAGAAHAPALRALLTEAAKRRPQAGAELLDLSLAAEGPSPRGAGASKPSGEQGAGASGDHGADASGASLAALLGLVQLALGRAAVSPPAQAALEALVARHAEPLRGRDGAAAVADATALASLAQALAPRRAGAAAALAAALDGLPGKLAKLVRAKLAAR
jgi:hypothetical protein